MSARVLVIEDDERIAAAIGVRLRAAGHEVRFAATGELGVERAMGDPPEVILLDIRLPDIEGFEVCQRLREWRELDHVGIAFLSAHSQASFQQRAMEVGGDVFLSKPFDTKEVLEVVRTLAARREANRAAS